MTSTRAWGGHGQRQFYARRGVDLATLTLARRVEDRHIFELGVESTTTGAPITTIGFPLGGSLKVSRGEVYRHLIDYGVPALAATADIEAGNSGGQMFNEEGEVVSVVSRIVISGSLTPDRSSRHGGGDIPRWWGRDALLDLCRAYPDSGIPDCRESDGAAPTKASVLLKSASA